MNFYRKYLFVICILHQSLVADFIQIPCSNMTQSEAHLSIPNIRQEVESWFHINDNPLVQDIWKKAIPRERQFNDTHYVFYHATSNIWRIPQDLFLKLYIEPRKGNKRIESFRAFRFIDAQDMTARAFVQDMLQKYGGVDDTKEEQRKHLLAANLALFGNVGDHHESSFNYFLDARSNRWIAEEDIRSVLDFFGLKEAPIKDILNLTDYLLGEEVRLRYKIADETGFRTMRPGTLYQIFLPKEVVDKYVYFSRYMGVPISVGNTVSGLLDCYKQNPSCVSNINALQARIIMTPKYLRDYASQVHVFAYDTISAENKRAYEQKLDGIVQEIIEKNVPQAHVSQGQKEKHKEKPQEKSRGSDAPVLDFGKALNSVAVMPKKAARNRR